MLNRTQLNLVDRAVRIQRQRKRYFIRIVLEITLDHIRIANLRTQQDVVTAQRVVEARVRTIAVLQNKRIGKRVRIRRTVRTIIRREQYAEVVPVIIRIGDVRIVRHQGRSRRIVGPEHRRIIVDHDADRAIGRLTFGVGDNHADRERLIVLGIRRWMLHGLRQGKGVGPGAHIRDYHGEIDIVRRQIVDVRRAIVTRKSVRIRIPHRRDRISVERIESRVRNRRQRDVTWTIDTKVETGKIAHLDGHFADYVSAIRIAVTGVTRQAFFVHRERSRHTGDRRAFVGQANLEGRRSGVVIAVFDPIGEGLHLIRIGRGDIGSRGVDQIATNDRNRATKAARSDNRNCRAALAIGAVEVVAGQIGNSADHYSGSIVVDRCQLAIIIGDRHIVDDVDLNRARAQNIPELVFNAIVEALCILDCVGGVLRIVRIGVRSIERIGVSPGSRIQYQCSVRPIRRTFEDIGECTGCTGNGDLASGEDFAAIALIGRVAVSELAGSVRKAGFIHKHIVVSDFGTNIIDVDRQRCGREISITIADSIDEHVLCVGIDNIGIGLVCVCSIHIKSQRTIKADDRFTDTTGNTCGCIVTCCAHTFDGRNAVGTGYIVVEHAIRIAYERSAFANGIGVRLSLWLVVDDRNDEIIRPIVRGRVAVKVDDFDGERHARVAVVHIVVAESIVLQRVGVADRTVASHRIVRDAIDDECPGVVIYNYLIILARVRIVVEIDLYAIDNDGLQTVGRIEGNCPGRGFRIRFALGTGRLGRIARRETVLIDHCTFANRRNDHSIGRILDIDYEIGIRRAAILIDDDVIERFSDAARCVEIPLIGI